MSTEFTDLNDFDGLVYDLADAVSAGDATVVGETDTTVAIDVDGDDVGDVILEDYDADGTVDTINIDEDADGLADVAILDTDQNGLSDIIYAGAADGDESSYGVAYVDENEDGITDATYIYDSPAGEWVVAGSSTSDDSDLDS